ncbi:MAG: formylmethanofuran dehydrogenase [Hyphomicrobium sp.]
MTATKSGNAPAGSAAPGVEENVACPFCGILCDDLEIGCGPSGLKVISNGCTKAIEGFERPMLAAKPQIGGRDVTLAEAVAEAARLIRGSRLPLFGGLGTDVEGMRAVMAAAECAGGVVDHAFSEGQYRNFEVLQTSGWFMSTLTEVRNRADLVVIVGSDVHTLHPRFFERIVAVPEPMFLAEGQKRTVVFIGDGLDASAAKGGSIGDVITLPCKIDAVGEVVSALRARLKGTGLAVESVAGIPLANIDDLAERCRTAHYGVMVWAPPSLAYPSADLTVRVISDVVKDLNLTTRFAGLALGGNEGAVSAGAVATWQSGFPLRVSYASGQPEYDSTRYAANRLLASGETDLLVWVASFSPDLVPPKSAVPTILIGVPGMKIDKAPLVSIPVGTPGLDHAGRLVRCDNVVSLPLKNLKRSALPAVSDVLASIEHAL